MTKGHIQVAISVATIPSATAILYLFGLTYHIGYLKAFGIEDSLFALASDKTLFTGFIATIDIGFMPATLIFFVVAIFFLLVLLLVILIFYTSIGERLRTKLTAKLKSWQYKGKPHPEANTIIDKIGVWLIYSATIFIILFIFASITLLAHKSGEKQASREMHEFPESARKITTVYSPLIKMPTNTLQIMCSDRYCAFWTGKETIVLKHDEITCLVMHTSNKYEENKSINCASGVMVK